MASLAWLRGWVPVQSIRQEYEVIYANVTKNFGERDSSCAGKLRPYKQRSFLWPYTIITICFFIGHFSGMTTLQTYAVQIFHTLKAPIDKYYATMLLGLAELLGTFLCILLVHTTGKRPIVLASTIGCGLCFLGTATYAYYLNEIPGSSISNVVANSSDILSTPLRSVVFLNETDLEDVPTENPFEYSFYRNDTFDIIAADSMMDFRVSGEEENADSAEVTTVLAITTPVPEANGMTAVQPSLPESFLIPVTKRAENKFLWVPLTLLLGSAVLSHCGIRLIPWMLIGEIYPTAVRGGASGLSGGTGYIFGFLSNKLFLKLLATLTLPGTFWMYSCVSLCGAAVLYFILPETEGRSLVDIEEHFTGGRTLKESQVSMKTNKNMLGNHNWERQPGRLGECGDAANDDGLKGNFRRSSCEVSNAANGQICSPVASSDSGDIDQQGVAAVVPNKRSCDSIGNTLLPITNPLQVQSEHPRIYVEFCSNNQTIGEADNSTKLNGSENQRTNFENDKLFEEAVQQREGAEWLRRIKDAHPMHLEHPQVLNPGLGMKRKRIL